MNRWSVATPSSGLCLTHGDSERESHRYRVRSVNGFIADGHCGFLSCVQSAGTVLHERAQ